MKNCAFPQHAHTNARHSSCFNNELSLCLLCTLQWDAVDAEIKVSLLKKKKKVIKVIPFKPGVSQNIVLHAFPTVINSTFLISTFLLVLHVIFKKNVFIIIIIIILLLLLLLIIIIIIISVSLKILCSLVNCVGCGLRNFFLETSAIKQATGQK